MRNRSALLYVFTLASLLAAGPAFAQDSGAAAPRIA